MTEEWHNEGQFIHWTDWCIISVGTEQNKDQYCKIYQTLRFRYSVHHILLFQSNSLRHAQANLHKIRIILTTRVIIMPLKSFHVTEESWVARVLSPKCWWICKGMFNKHKYRIYSSHQKNRTCNPENWTRLLSLKHLFQNYIMQHRQSVISKQTCLYKVKVFSKAQMA